MNQTLQISAPVPGESAQSWRTERATLDEAIREIRRWIKSAKTAEPKPVDELQGKLVDFSCCLRSHWEHGSELYDALRESLWCVEVESAQRNAQADYSYLLGRLNAITTPIEVTDSEPVSFQQMTEQLEWFFDELDQHEEREADCFDWLLQTSCD